MSVRVQVSLDEKERGLFQREAAREGLSLSRWLRNAASERLERCRENDRLRSPEDLQAFFRECAEREQGQEPDWVQHLEVMRQSRSQGDAGG